MTNTLGYACVTGATFIAFTSPPSSAPAGVRRAEGETVEKSCSTAIYRSTGNP